MTRTTTHDELTRIIGDAELLNAHLAGMYARARDTATECDQLAAALRTMAERIAILIERVTKMQAHSAEKRL